MIIYSDGTSYQMTLVIGVHNDKDYVIGSDTLVKIVMDGRPMIWEEGHKKIFILNPSTAMFINGQFSAEMRQFALDFAENNKDDTDLISLGDKIENSPTRPTLKENDKLKFNFVGFTNGRPDTRSIGYIYGESEPRKLMQNGNMFATGYDNPQELAMKLMNKAINKNGSDIAGLRKIVKSTLLKCIREYKDSDSERLGGQPDIHILHKN